MSPSLPSPSGDPPPGHPDPSRPLLTVAIPVFNRERELGPMLSSLDSQDWSSLEVRFGDDGSTDGTPAVLAAFLERHPGRAFVERHGNMGPGPSRNRLLEQAAGEYIWFCDSDDELAPGAIAAISSILSETPCDALSFVYGHGRCPADPVASRLDAPNVAVSPSQLMMSFLGATVAKVFRTDMLRTGGVSFPPFRAGEDWVFTAQAGCLCKSGRFWSAVPYWARNGFWQRNGDRHLTGKVDDAFCECFAAAFSELLAIREAHPELRLELEVMAWNLASHLRNQIREAAPGGVREKWLPVAERFFRDLGNGRDNPLLRFPAGVTALGTQLFHARARERAMLESLSWRITAPLRAIADVFSRKQRS